MKVLRLNLDRNSKGSKTLCFSPKPKLLYGKPLSGAALVDLVQHIIQFQG